MKLRYPPNILEKHRHALDRVATDLEQEFGPTLLSLVIGGSVGSGKAQAHSDMDVCIIADVNWYQRRRLVIDGETEVDVFVDFPARVHAEINLGNHVFLRMHGIGWIAYDTASIAVQAKKAAEGLLHNPMRPIDAGHAFTLRNRAKDVLSDFHRAVGVDDVSAKYLLSILVPWCISATFRIRRHWPGPEKRDLQELKKFAPDVHALAVQLLSEVLSMSERAALVDRFVEAVFGKDLHKAVDVGPKGGLPEQPGKPSAPPPVRVRFDGKNVVVRR